jgi:hypothetical protein
VLLGQLFKHPFPLGRPRWYTTLVGMIEKEPRAPLESVVSTYHASIISNSQENWTLRKAIDKFVISEKTHNALPVLSEMLYSYVSAVCMGILLTFCPVLPDGILRMVR